MNNLIRPSDLQTFLNLCNLQKSVASCDFTGRVYAALALALAQQYEQARPRPFVISRIDDGYLVGVEAQEEVIQSGTFHGASA